MSDFRGVVVPAITPLPPDLSLMGSALRPDKAATAPGADVDAAGLGVPPEQLGMLPAELRAELTARKGDDWVRGITWAPENRREAIVRDPCDETTVIPRGDNLPVRMAIPYVIYAEDACSAFGWEERDFQGRAKRLVENAKFKAVEAEFWSGTLAQAAGWPNDFLTNVETVTDLTPAGGPPSVLRGLQILQDALAECGFGGKGMIHVQRQTATNLLTVEPSDPHFLTTDNVMHDLFGNIIVPGVGYPGTGPEGKAPAAGSAWMYATDLVAVREEAEPTIFPDSFAQAMNWGQQTAEEAEEETTEANTIRFGAQKFAIAYWDGACHLAVRVKLSE